MQLSPGFLDLCTLQVTRTHRMFKYHGSSDIVSEIRLFADDVFAIVKLRMKKTQWNFRGILIGRDLGQESWV